MSYAVKEMYYTLQGEGANTGRAAVFVRFAGCNLWSGLEKDRASAVCKFCDTDFVGVDGPGGGRFPDAIALALSIVNTWPTELPQHARPLVVFTGGEPLLQMDEALIEACHVRGLEVAIETNGTRTPPAGIDWICVSPKVGAELVLTSGSEIKLVYPQDGGEPELYQDLEFDHFFLQPMDGPDLARNTSLATQYCLAHPQWRLSLQTHKLLGLR
ncbi:MAG: 7-carboxy-7-deazaguanine synthase [Acidobacteriia bacterium]|nr:7-carboxy-7-deazaguanine synthase [Terriglobia bacterium]